VITELGSGVGVVDVIVDQLRDVGNRRGIKMKEKKCRTQAQE
jgi:hypothetical protein